MIFGNKGHFYHPITALLCVQGTTGESNMARAAPNAPSAPSKVQDGASTALSCVVQVWTSSIPSPWHFVSSSQ